MYDQAHGVEKTPDIQDDYPFWITPEIGFQWYQQWVMSNYVVYPYPGSLADQPYYVQKQFHLYQQLERWHKINAKRMDVSGFPNIEDA